MMQNTAVATIVKTIIDHQQMIIGPLAIEQAIKVPGISASLQGDIQIDNQVSDTKDMLVQLVARYEELFGQTSVEVCRDAVRDVHTKISDKDLPDILK